MATERWSGRSVLVTGAAGGIGAALARRFAREGCRVALLDRDVEGVHARARELREAGTSVLPLAGDVTSASDCESAVKAVLATHGALDVLVNNAGVTHLGAFREVDVEVLRRVMDVNFFGAVQCTKAALPALLESRGRIVVLSSVAGFAPLATRSGYAASKHALHGFFDSLRAEHRDDGLRVLLVCPWFVDTRIGDHALGPDGGAVAPAARTGARGMISPERLADAIVAAAGRDRRLLLVPGRARLAWLVSRLAPVLYERLMLRQLGS